MKAKLLICWIYGASLIMSLSLASRVMADPPVVHQSTIQNEAGVVGENTAGGDGVFGVGGTTGRGVVGTSDNHTGVEGNSIGNGGIGVFGSGKSGRGVVGISEKNTAVEGNSNQGTGVWGSTNNASTAGAEFHNNGGGDLIRAGKNTEFRVQNNGDVLVRDKLLGQKGDKGDTGGKGADGERGIPGPPGPVSRAGCMCNWQSTNQITGFCTDGGGSGQAVGGIAECVSAAQQFSRGACNISCR